MPDDQGNPTEAELNTLLGWDDGDDGVDTDDTTTQTLAPTTPVQAGPNPADPNAPVIQAPPVQTGPNYQQMYEQNLAQSQQQANEVESSIPDSAISPVDYSGDGPQFIIYDDMLGIQILVNQYRGEIKVGFIEKKFLPGLHLPCSGFVAELREHMVLRKLKQSTIHISPAVRLAGFRILAHGMVTQAVQRY